MLAAMAALAELHDHCCLTEEVQPLIMSAVQEELSMVVRDWLTDGRQHGVRDEAARETAAAGVSWAIFGAALAWSRSSPRPEAEVTAEQMARLLMKGLATGIASNGDGQSRRCVS
jgi:AcrR family transcriptional regulator